MIWYVDLDFRVREDADQVLTLETFKSNNAMGGTPKHIKKDWGLGGVLILGDSEEGMKAGTMLWGGLPNLIWVRVITLLHLARMRC
jgi:hypothetical protein